MRICLLPEVVVVWSNCWRQVLVTFCRKGSLPRFCEPRTVVPGLVVQLWSKKIRDISVVCIFCRANF